MSFHKAIVFIISTLAQFIQVEFQTKTSTPFNTHCRIMYTFFVVLFSYGVAWATLALSENDIKYGRVLTKFSLLWGTLASILLLIIIRQVLGWVALLLWFLYLLKTAYELIDVDAFYQLLQNLKNSFSQFFIKFKNALFGQSEDGLPVRM